MENTLAQLFVTFGASHAAFLKLLSSGISPVSRRQVVASDSGRIVILEYDGTKNMPLALR